MHPRYVLLLTQEQTLYIHHAVHTPQALHTLVVSTPTAHTFLTPGLVYVLGMLTVLAVGMWVAR